MCLSLLTIIGAQAESVTFNVCSWDAKNKSVTITQLTHDCTPIEGQHWDWMPLGENGKETWYVVKGSDVSRKVLVIFGTVHLVLPDGSKLTCNHIKLEARNNAILHVHGQSSFPGKLNVINYSEGETTSIEVLKNGRKEELKLDGVWYDLSGRKVADSSRSSLLQERYLHREW